MTDLQVLTLFKYIYCMLGLVLSVDLLDLLLILYVT